MVKAIEKENQPRFFWFFFHQWKKEQRYSRSCKLRVTCFETESCHTTPALRTTPPKKEGNKDKE
jgi:hypothetical protein